MHQAKRYCGCLGSIREGRAASPQFQTAWGFVACATRPPATRMRKLLLSCSQRGPSPQPKSTFKDARTSSDVRL